MVVGAVLPMWATDAGELPATAPAQQQEGGDDQCGADDAPPVEAGTEFRRQWRPRP